MEQEASQLEQILSLRREANSEIVNVDEPTVKLVIFELGGEWFAFAGESVREILPQVETFFVPGCPASLEGVINVRGDIESVLSLSELLGKPAAKAAPESLILRGAGGGMHSGIRVDQVVDVLDVVQSAISPPPSTLPDNMRRIVSGVMRHQEKPVTILDLQHIFTDYRRTLG